jgi:protein-S-isoprenylcysteine O-methyltransferase Ste14
MSTLILALLAVVGWALFLRQVLLTRQRDEVIQAWDTVALDEGPVRVVFPPGYLGESRPDMRA